MSEEQRRLDEERRLRRLAVANATRQSPDPGDSDDTDGSDDEEEEETVAARRMEQRALWVDLQVRNAMERGEFDNLPGAGKPIPGLDGVHDPDWWVKGLIEREKITGVLPPALLLRKQDAELDAQLDREVTEDGVRRTVEDFNHAVVEARRQLLGGPPVITPTRDVDLEIAAWRERREERRERRTQRRPAGTAPHPTRRPPWWRRRH